MSFRDNGNPILTPGHFGPITGAGRMTRLGTYIWLLALFSIVLCTGLYTAKTFFAVYQDAGIDLTRIERIKNPENEKRNITVYRIDGNGGEYKIKGEVEYSYIPMPEVANGKLKTVVLVGCLVGFGIAMFIIFNPKYARLCSPVYAFSEGIALGGVSAWYEMIDPGIALTALVASVSIFGLMYICFALKLLRPTAKSTQVVIFAMFGLLLLYIADLFVPGGFDIVRGYGLGAIVVSIVACGLASWNFVIDFDVIEEGIEYQAPKYMEAYAAFGVMLTFVWLYLELLRLFFISKERRR